MKMRLINLPIGLAPIVEQYGFPVAEVSGEMSNFRWSLPKPEFGDGRPEPNGLILARVESESDLPKCVHDIEELEARLKEVGRVPDAIVASCAGLSLSDLERPDLAWARSRVETWRHSWMAVNDFEAAPDRVEDLATVFLWPDTDPVGAPGDDHQLITLMEGELVAADVSDLFLGPFPDWERLTP